jgi:hypothetical protein
MVKIELALHEITRERLAELKNDSIITTVRLTFRSGESRQWDYLRQLEQLRLGGCNWPSRISLLELDCDEGMGDDALEALRYLIFVGPCTMSVNRWPRNRNPILLGTLCTKTDLNSLAILMASHYEASHLTLFVESGIPGLVLHFEDERGEGLDWTPLALALSSAMMLRTLGLGGYVPASAYPPHLPAGLRELQLSCKGRVELGWLHHEIWPRTLRKVVIQDAGTDIFLPDAIINRLRHVDEVVIGDQRMSWPPPSLRGSIHRVDVSELRGCLRLIQGDARLQIREDGTVQISSSDKDAREFFSVRFHAWEAATGKITISLPKRISCELVAALVGQRRVLIEYEQFSDSKVNLSIPSIGWARECNLSLGSAPISIEEKYWKFGTPTMFVPLALTHSMLSHLSQFSETVDVAMEPGDPGKAVLFTGSSITLRVAGIALCSVIEATASIKRINVYRLLELLRFGIQLGREDCMMAIVPAGLIVSPRGFPHAEGLFKETKNKKGATQTSA